MTGDMVLWRAGCGVSRTSGSEGGPGRRTSREARTAPWSRPYVGAYLCRSIATPDVTAADFQTVEPALLHELDLAFFEDRFEGATPTEQRVLEAMAREPGQIRLTRLRPHVGDVPSVDLVVRRLVERGLIHRAARGTYDFSLPMFSAYVRRRQGNLSNVSRSERLAAVFGSSVTGDKSR